jgi:hypothetical protein
MSRDGDDRRGQPPRVTTQRPLWLTSAQQEHFKDLGTERFQDTAFQRYAQSFRTHASLSAAGKLGWAVTTARYGAEFAWDRAADKRRAHPEKASRDEQRMMKMLSDLGQVYRSDYTREHKVAPRTHVDFAWPRLGKALEVYGGVHFGAFFNRDGVRAADDARKVAAIRAAGWQVLVITSEDLLRGHWEATRERVRAFLTEPPGHQNTARR